MITDCFSGRHSSGSRPAVAAFEEAVVGVAAHRPSVASALDRTLAADPAFVAAHALKGFATVILAREELEAPALDALGQAEAALARHGRGTLTERILVRALKEAVAGRLSAAAAVLDAHLVERPRDLLALKLSHALHFMRGESIAMLTATSRALDGWTSSLPGYGFVLGCHAFGLEESGDRVGAEAVGQAALGLEPRDAWGLHAVAHVYEMSGRSADGMNWLDRSRPAWSQCNNFAFHVAWHLALFLHAQGCTDRALEIYDTEVRPAPTDDFRDVANAVSFLWRFGQEGIDVGDRWTELQRIAHRRRHDTTLVFASLHYLMALVATGTMSSARELAAAIEQHGRAGTGDQAGVAATVGHALAIEILALGERRSGRGDLSRLVALLPRVGGSHAQRDVFVRTLALIATDRGDRAAADRVLALRRQLKRDDRFVSLVERRLRAAENECHGWHRTAPRIESIA
ncbi:MAG: tetratricopeptide repeat protein [Geminicoccaceae bacterium]